VRCCVCQSHVLDSHRCRIEGCGKPLCPELDSPDCPLEHGRVDHPVGNLLEGGVRGYVKTMKAKVASSEAQAVAFRDRNVTLKAESHAFRVNAEARFWAIKKHLKAAHPGILAELEQVNLFKDEWCGEDGQRA
jgi:hypothetical protein